MIQKALPHAKNSVSKPMAYVYKANTEAFVEQDWERSPGDGDISLF
jgi:hypothetical protein